MQVISDLTLTDCFPLKLKEDPSFKYLQSPHLGSLHFVTVNFVSFLFENFALVSNFYKFRAGVYFLKKFSLKIMFSVFHLLKESPYICTLCPLM